MEELCTIIAWSEPMLVKDEIPSDLQNMGFYSFIGDIFFPEKNQKPKCSFEAIMDVANIDKIHQNTTFRARVKFENGKYYLLEILSIEPNP